MSGSLVIVTPVPSPYQVELFNAVTAHSDLELHVIYMLRRHRNRYWEIPELRHKHSFCNDGSHAWIVAKRQIDGADLAVFSWYADVQARELIRQRAHLRRPWVYWGERPGFGGWGWFGRVRRQLYLAPLHRYRVPIWGIGSWSIPAWQKEFGGDRLYQNVPYFSDLSRFSHRPKGLVRSGVRRFLFSGELSPRKGVDLLAEAFIALAATRPHMRLDVVGCGSLEPSLRQKLEQCGSQVQFFGFRQWRELPAFYQAADFLVAPSRYDGWGMVVPEGLAAGLPVLSTDRTGAAMDLLTPGRNGWVVSAGDGAALAKAMAEAADVADGKLSQMSDAARASVVQHSLAHGVDRFIAAAMASLEESTAE